MSEDILLQQTRDLDAKYVLHTYNRSLAFAKGEGTRLYDTAGNAYLDFTSGISVCNLGHCHPAVTAALQAQCAQLVHCSNLFYNLNQPKLAEIISTNSFGGKVFFGNSGAEANEGLIKFARRWGSLHGGRHEIICANHCFHGRTLATLAATAKQKYREGFQPDMPGFRFAEFNDLDSFRSQINDKTVAIMVEAVQGEGGVNPATQEFLAGLRQLCDEKNLLLLCDEVQCGMGRTGKLFAFQNYGITPDGFSLAKAIANGIPMGAFVIKAEHADVFAPGLHGSTFGGTPLACAASLAVFDTLLRGGVLAGVQAKGQFFRRKLEELQAKHHCIKEVRSLGLMLGMSVGELVKTIPAACQRRHLLVLTAGEDVIRLLPPLTVTEAEIAEAVAILDQAIQEAEENKEN